MAHPFATLTPDLVLDAVESIGFLSDARVLALNSYENRVYQVGIEHEVWCEGFKRVGHADSCAQQAAASGQAW